jgi:hypothetical protein
MRQPKNRAAHDTSVVLVHSITNGRHAGWEGPSRRGGIPTRCGRVYSIVAVADNILNYFFILQDLKAPLSRPWIPFRVRQSGKISPSGD